MRTVLDSGKVFSQLSDEQLAEHSELLAANAPELREVLQQGSWLESKVSEGGASSARLVEQLAAARAVLQQSAVGAD